MNRKEKILSYFNSQSYIPLKLRELKIVLDVPEKNTEEFEKIIAELEFEGKIIISKRGRIVPVDNSNDRFVGVLKCHASGNFGFVICENSEDIFVSVKNMGPALHNDKVLVKKIGCYKGKTEGSVIKVIQRSDDKVVGVVLTKRGHLLRVRPDKSEFFHDLYVLDGESNGALPGDRVAMCVVRSNPDGRVFAKITTILGKSDDIKSLVEGIIIENKIKTSFDPETLAQCNRIDEIQCVSDEKREDFRSVKIFTIDGETAKDFDDAVSIQQLENGLFRLGVHIADVSEYVQLNSPTDMEAFERGTSVYLPDRVIPMLPEKLSNGLCSLVPGEDRLTLSVMMDIDLTGKVVDYRITKSMIRSRWRLTYNEVNKMLSDNDSNLKEKYKDVLCELQLMEKLAEILRTRRFERGAIDFDFPESEIITDSFGMPLDVYIAERGVSNKMIEEFMLITNETVAEFAYWSELPLVYRSHEPPAGEKLESFVSFIKPFGLSIKGRVDSDNPVKPKAFEQILKKVQNTPLERIVSRTMLRSLMKADYKSVNTGHFGLASEYYCHFTSPIRRYPDLVVHRSIKNMLDGKESLSFEYVSKAAKCSSECEIKAEICERDCDDLFKTLYLEQYIGESFDAVVSGVTGFGMFVEIGNGIEGLIRLESITDDYYVYKEEELSIIGERTNNRYTIGDEVNVVPVKCDVYSRRIDFVLTKHFSTKFFKHTEKRRKKR